MQEQEAVHSEISLQGGKRKSFWDEKRRILYIFIPIVVIVSMLVSILLGTRHDLDSIVGLVTAIFLNVLTLMWCKLDSDGRKYKPGQPFTFAVVILGLFALLYYLFRSRGVKGGLISTGWLILYVIGLSVVSVVVATIIAFLLLILHIVPRSVFKP